MFYRNMFELIGRLCINPAANNSPETMAYVGVVSLAYFNFMTIYVLIKSFFPTRIWPSRSWDANFLLVVGVGMLTAFYFVFLHKARYKKLGIVMQNLNAQFRHFI